MGQKNNPIILRIKKTNQFWNSCWYSDHDYAARFLEDCKIKTYIENCSQQLRKISPVLFVKRQRGDLQIAVFSAKFTRLSEIVRRGGRSLQKNVFPPRFSVALGSAGLGTESNKIKKHPLLFSATPHLGLHVDQQLPGFKGVQPVSLISLLSVCGVGSCNERITSTIGSGKSGLVGIKKSDLKKEKACFSYSLVTSKVKKKKEYAQQTQGYALQPQINFFKESVFFTARKFPGISPERKNTVKKEYKKYGRDFLKFLLFAKRLGIISSPFFAPIPTEDNAVSKYTKTFLTTESGFTQNLLIPKDMKISPSFMSHEKHLNLEGYDITESLQNGDLPQRSCGKQMLQNKKKTIEPQGIPRIGWSASQPLGIASPMRAQQTTVEKPVSGYHLTHQLKGPFGCVEDAPLTPFAFFQSIPKEKSFQSSGIEGTKQKNTGDKNKKPIMLVKMPVKNYMEHSIYRITQLRCKIQLLKCPSIHQNPFFLAGQVVSLLQERVPFRQLKHRIIKEIKGDAMIKGVRILCSGRVASRSKKAQKARRESVQWGSTSLNVFSECLHFASCFAQTTFGKVGVKVWICYEKGKIRNFPIKPRKP